MLLQLFIKNIALIDQIELSFGKGLHVMTGETGAGKSIRSPHGCSPTSSPA